MTVLFYGEGEHPTGFVGFRVATTLGAREGYSQKYFSLNEFSITTAERLAHEKNDRLREQAKENKRSALLNHQPAVNYIARNFKAAIRSRREKLSSGFTIYNVPFFVVGSGAQTVEFPIGRKYTYQKAFELAVKEYARMYDLNDVEIELIKSRQPPASVFFDYLYTKALKKGTAVSLSDLLGRLSTEDPSL